MAEVSLPAIEYMMSPTLLALHNLGGSGTNDDIYSEVVEILNLTPEQEAVMHNPDKDSRTEIKYRLFWARTRLKQAGYIDNPRRAFWELTEKGWNTTEVHIESPPARRRKRRKKSAATSAQAQENALAQETLISLDELVESAKPWKDELQDILYRLSPEKFESFLRIVLGAESNNRVEIISNDGVMLEGKMTSGGFIATNIWFHFYRAGNPILASAVDDLRRAVLMNRADRGLLITLGKATQEAQRQADNSRTPVIQLMHGDLLIGRLKELGIGLGREILRVERVVIKRDFFDNL